MSHSHESMSIDEIHDEEFLIGGKKKKKAKDQSKFDAKSIAFMSIGFITMLYVLGELGAAIYINSLVLLSDGFHNLSDVVSLYIAYWAQQAGKREQTQDMSYGWARTEILGGLTNGCFLLSLCLYVALESIPKFINPIPIESGFLFMLTAGIGLAVNTIGTIVFLITGNSHGHSHSHGHGHGHGHKEGKKGEKKEKHGHEHGHKHKEVLEDVHVPKEKKDKKEKKEGHSHGHGHKDKKKKDKKKRDLNVHAVFLHYLGDAISSVMVLAAGALIHFFDGAWTHYIDPISSLLIVGIILFTTVPLVKRCSMILLQSTPNNIDVESVKLRLLRVEGLVSVHDFHIWQLVDGMVITSVHIGVEEGADFTHIVDEVKKIFHDYGIHSSSIQPEFVPRNAQADYCEQNCVKECAEDWCCKQTAEKRKTTMEEFSVASEL